MTGLRHIRSNVCNEKGQHERCHGCICECHDEIISGTKTDGSSTPPSSTAKRLDGPSEEREAHRGTLTI